MVTPRGNGALGRSLRVARLGAGLAGSYLGYQVQRLWLDKQGADTARKAMRRRQGERLREGLGSLRGAVMKLGQALSMQRPDLSPEVLAEIAGLQTQAPPMHESLMRAQFRNALGADPEEVFKSFEPLPFAAASLGQAHRAVTKNGERVCVKIQYPAIREAIQNDFKALRAVSLPARLSRHLPEALIAEAEKQFLEETDYRKEAANLESFAEGLRPFPFVRAPKPLKKLSAEKVLTMSFLDGRHLDECLAGKPSRQWRDLVGARLFELFFHQVFVMGALHADPHAGNYLFEEDGTIGLIDFGCVKHLAPRVTREFRKVLRREWARDENLYRELVRGLCASARDPGNPAGFDEGKKHFPVTRRGREVDPDDPAVRKAMAGLREVYDLLYPIGSELETKVDFGNPALLRRLETLVGQLIAQRFASAEFLFFSRAESGLYNMLHRLGSRLPTGRMAMEFLDRTEKGGG